ncbi:hypothetical protein A2U01_0099007, partial [Trifolium medium]|nr:hypothetical protein [Trifolium medium]
MVMEGIIVNVILLLPLLSALC